VGHYKEGEEPTDEAIRQTLCETVAVLETSGCTYLLMGGLLSTSVGRPRTTDDIDVFVRPHDAKAVLQALELAGFETEETFPDWLFKAWRHGVLVDLIFRSAGDIYLDDEMVEHARTASFDGVEVPVISTEDLLVIKAVATKESTPHHWYDAIGLIARSDLDWDYLVRRARQAGPRRVLSLLVFAESEDLAVSSDAIDALYRLVSGT
jgi:predicted nucleotidyltransferase